MSSFTLFAITLGGLLVVAVMMLSWTFRSTSAPFWTKLALPFLGVMLAAYVPMAVRPMMGRVLEGTYADMPDDLELIAYHSPGFHSSQIDLWVVEDGQPRAYRVPLTSDLENLLKKVKSDLDEKRPVFLHRKPRKLGGMAKVFGVGAKDNPNGLEYELRAPQQMPVKP